MTSGVGLPTVSLKRLFPRSSFVGCADIRVYHAANHSLDCLAGSLFAVISGSHRDGRQFVDDAVSHGATSLLVSCPLAGAAVPQCVVPDVRRSYARLCTALVDDPVRRLKIAGVTGTNGKTTVTWMLRSILRAAGVSAGLLGTIEYDDGRHTRQARLTTPESAALAGWLATMVAHGTTHTAIELSSHALDQDRASAIELDAAVLTNVTHDHFDYHGDLPSYLAAKRRILSLCRPDALVVWNADDELVCGIAEQLPGHVRGVSFALDRPADVTARVIEESRRGSRFVLAGADDGDEVEIEMRLVGRHNIANALAAAAVARGFGIAPGQIAAGIAGLASIPGRLESIDCGQSFDVFVDYAHTPDALERSLSHLRRLIPGSLICVFGAGGDRDPSKRPLLGAAATAADRVIVTSDNPRTEPPLRIIEAVVEGVVRARGEPLVEPDRAAAIGLAIELAGPGDCVLVAGKGHETHQVVGSRRIAFDDRQVLRTLLSGPAWSERIGA